MERRSVYVACLLLTAALATITECRSPLKISAFNIQVFGRTKLSRTEVVGVLKQVRAGVSSPPPPPSLPLGAQRAMFCLPSPTHTSSS